MVLHRCIHKFVQNRLCRFRFQLQQAQKTYNFCRSFYQNHGRHKMMTTMLQQFHSKRPWCMFAVAACSFSWENNGVSNDEILSRIEELDMLESAQDATGITQFLANQSEYKNVPDEWINILDERNIKMWKLPLKKTNHIQYKVFGRFHDITALQFFQIQTDLEYRMKWDKLVIDVNVVDENLETEQKVLKWITYFPYPFKAREYVFVRKVKIMRDSKILAILARSVDHPKCITSKNHVRVPLYLSDMVIKPHKQFDEPGLDYLLTYCDDPQTSVPTRLASWVVTTGIPDYIEKLHVAALNMRKDTSRSGKTTTSYERTSTSSDKQSPHCIQVC